MPKNAIVTVSCLLLASATLCQAQSSQQQRIQRVANPFAETFGVHGYRHASTYQQSVLDGMANLVGARAQAHYYNNLARLMNERVRAARMWNQTAKVIGNYAKIEKRKEYFARRREQIRQKKEAAQIGQSALVAVNYEHQPIAWPSALKTDRYSSHRNVVETLWQLKVQNGRKSSEPVEIGIRHGLRELAKKIIQDENSGQLDQQQSREVRKFVRVLYQAADQPAQHHADLVAMK